MVNESRELMAVFNVTEKPEPILAVSSVPEPGKPETTPQLIGLLQLTPSPVPVHVYVVCPHPNPAQKTRIPATIKNFFMRFSAFGYPGDCLYPVLAFSDSPHYKLYTFSRKISV
jgi:hypothetical protein